MKYIHGQEADVPPNSALDLTVTIAAAASFGRCACSGLPQLNATLGW